VSDSLLEGGADIRLIQQFLGQSKLDTTSIYMGFATKKFSPENQPKAALSPSLWH
jgi:site-specific recombinase XerD